MIKLKELNKHKFPTTPEIDVNLLITLERLNALQAVYNEPMIITSGLRSESLQQVLIKTGRSNASKSKHLTGQAADIYDPDGKFWAWLMEHIPLLESIGIWLEDKKSTPVWVHCQIIPPISGHRIFLP